MRHVKSFELNKEYPNKLEHSLANIWLQSLNLIVVSPGIFNYLKRNIFQLIRWIDNLSVLTGRGLMNRLISCYDIHGSIRHMIKVSKYNLLSVYFITHMPYTKLQIY